MNHSDLDALLQGALDNTLTPEEQARLARMLSEQPRGARSRRRIRAARQPHRIARPGRLPRRASSTTFSRKFRIIPMQFARQLSREV